VEAGGHVAGTDSKYDGAHAAGGGNCRPDPGGYCGGIADGRGLAAALALGAEGVVIGTRLDDAVSVLLNSIEALLLRCGKKQTFLGERLPVNR
jgi:hypothetical protein